MACTSYSLLMSSTILPIFILIVSGATTAADLLACNVPRKFTLEISDNREALIYESKLNIRIEKNDIKVSSYLETNNINFQADNVIVAFKGSLIINDVRNNISTAPERISQIYKDKISVTAQRVIMRNLQSQSDCRVILLPTETNRASVHSRIANEIRRLAESCVELEICPEIDEMMTRDAEISPSKSKIDIPLIYNTVPILISRETPETKCASSSPTVNKLVDMVLAELVNKLRENNGDKVSMPDIDFSFSTGSWIFKTNGHFQASDGTFGDLTSIQRTSDASLSHDGMKFIISSGYGLTIADVNYENYGLKYGIIRTSGTMSGHTDGMSLKASVAVDYTQKPCLMTLEELQVTELGSVQITLTGLSPFNWIVAKYMDSVIAQEHDDIVQNIEGKIRKTMESTLSTLNCERFRP